MRSLCYYFQVHQPFRLRTYRFFDIGKDHYYYDDYLNRSIIKRVAEKCYLPANKVILDLIKEYGRSFKVSYSISGTAIDQLESVAPEVIESFQKLAATGCVEFIAETYAHSLSSLKSREEFFEQVRLHSQKMEILFGQKPRTFRNTELIYSDDIGEMVFDMGFDMMLTEGAKHILGWKSPNYMYCSSRIPKLKLLLRNFRLSDDLSFRFSLQDWNEWPMTTEKFADWLNAIPSHEEVVNIFVDYETFGERQWKETGIFEFLRDLPRKVFAKTKFTFNTPYELSTKLQPVSSIHVPHAISWADEERDLTAWLGNELQDEAFNNLYSIEQKVKSTNDPQLINDWRYLQGSDHFYYMCTKWFSNGYVHKFFNPYPSPYDSFINYMNVLADFMIRIDDRLSGSFIPEQVTKEEKKSELGKGRKVTRKKSERKPAAKPATVKVKTTVKKGKKPAVKAGKRSKK
ncbi:MAG: glycoside hydrolase family 57 protein [Bacteroidetes bacterium]|nr:glycoside hydrolase family 57 protein [Bacteroidota bacterium]